MTTATSQRQLELTRRTVVVIGGGAGMILAGRNPGRLGLAAAGLPEQIDHGMVAAAGPAFR